MALERSLSEKQRARMRKAFREAGPEAVQGFRTVLEKIVDPELRHRVQEITERADG
jgi:hypothetical protein